MSSLIGNAPNQVPTNGSLGTLAFQSANGARLNTPVFTGDPQVGTVALATNATTGFFWIPSCAGAPTGAPTAPYTGACGLVVDSTNNRLYVRVGAAWKYVALT